MKTIRYGMGLVLATWLGAGCDVATSRSPVGARPAAVRDLGLDGVWRDPGGKPYFVRTVDESAGRLEVATVKTNAAGFVLELTEVRLRQEGDQGLVNLRESSPNPPEEWVFGRWSAQEDQVLVALASTRGIRSLAIEGRIGALVKTNNSDGKESYEVTVTNGFQRLASELAAPGGWQWLDMDHILTFTRQRSGFD